MSGTLYLLFGAVALLLAIGCGNVSILLLARGTARQHEFAVRAAVGAHSRRIVRQLLTESLLLAAAGVVLGVLTSYGILAGIRLVLPRFAFAPEVVIRINLPVLFFSAAVALATALLFGLWPALQLSRTAGGPGHGVQRAPRRRQCTGTQGAQCADRRANRAHPGFTGRSGFGDGKLSTPDAYAAGLRSAPRDLRGHSAAGQLLHDLGRAQRIFRTAPGQGVGNARRHPGGDIQQCDPAAKRMECPL